MAKIEVSEPSVETRTSRELPILEWVEGLAAVAAKNFTQDDVQGYVFQHNIAASSLQPYTFFSKHKYTRNLIFQNDLFQCMAVCWEIGQSSPIHDHNDKMGWMYLADGQLYVQNYRVDGRDPANRCCRLVPGDGAELGGDNNTCVDKDENVHMICNLPKYKKRAISVHIYEQPMTHCEIYSLQKGTYDVVELAYTSEYGRLNPGVEL
jgi:predicted metal-dependent enzyme (double-stranded beta helix superfamily)